MKILLVNPPIEKMDVKRRANFPLGLAYIAKTIQAEGVEPVVLDILMGELDKAEVEDYIKNNKFDAIGITSIITTFVYIIWLTSIIKKYHPDTLIFCGGSLATTSPKILLKNTMIDIVIISEGEITTKKLLGSFKDGNTFKNTKGIYYKDATGKVVKNEPEKRIDDLDTVPYPAWELFDMEKYMSTYLPLLDLKWKYNKRWVSMISSRGCPYGCTFCGKTFGKFTRLRSAENIIGEIKYLIDNYNLDHINFCDDFFSVDKVRVIKICDYLNQLDKKITWTASVRADSLDEEMVKKMKGAGCLGYCLGIESGDQGMLDRMQKSSSVETAEKAIAITKKHGIFPHCSMIIGLPGESEKTIQASVDFLKRTKVYPIPFNFVVPLPGSKLYREMMEKGVIQNEFEYLKKVDNEFHSNLFVNCTDMSDQELIDLKKQSEAELRKNYLKRHPFWGLKRLGSHLFHYGLKGTVGRLKNSLGLIR